MNDYPTDSLPNPDVILQTERMLAVCKPGGLLTQAPSGIDSMEVRIKRMLARQESNQSQTDSPTQLKIGPNTGGVKLKNGQVYLGVPHRLDRPASGAMVFAKNRKAARYLSEQFQRREVEKTYWTLIVGTPETESGTWIDWMRKVPDEARSEICGESDQGAQKAILHFKVVNSSTSGTLLEIDLETGRSHQIRLQASSRGLAIHGDTLYGSSVPFGPETEDTRSRWIALHARQIIVNSPDTKERIKITAPLPGQWPERT